MHVAFINVGATGHVLASLPGVEELARRGVRVSYFTSEYLRKMVEPCGVEFHAVDSVLTKGGNTDKDIAVDMIAEIPLRFLSEAEAAISQILPLLEQDKPDIIISDTMALAGRLAASALGVPRIQFYTSYASNSHFSTIASWPQYPDTNPARAKAKALAEKFRQQYGGKLLDVKEIFEGPGDFNIVTLAKSFQPAGDTFGDEFFFAGAQIAPRANSGSWAVPANDKPLIYTSFGTLFNHWPEFYQILFDAVRGLDVNVVSAIGSNLKIEELGEVPPNVQLHAFLPQLEVLKKADMFVTHAGTGSVMEAIWFGVPLFCLPQMDEQVMTANRVKQLGIGNLLADKGTLTSDVLRDAIQDVLKNNTYREKIAAMQKDMQTNGGYGKVADAVMDFAEKYTDTN